MSHTSQARPRVSGKPATWAAKQSAVLEERNRLAGEIHDGLAQSFTAICMLTLAWQKLAVSPTICV
jgi:signal transduction histidine kinase